MPQRPNILLITADQLRADALGCYGNEICRTPNLDALAGGGVVFENAFTPNPICVPARASITTGNYSHVCTGTKSNGGRIKDDQTKLAEHFVANGYEAYACGKLHYAPYAPPGEPRLLHGFQHCDLHESGRLVNQVILQQAPAIPGATCCPCCKKPTWLWSTWSAPSPRAANFSCHPASSTSGPIPRPSKC